jgi:hypothetical protein
MPKSFLGNLLSSFDGFNFLEQESANDSGLNAAAAKHASIGSRDRFILLGESFVVIRPQLGNAVDPLAAVAAVVGSPRTVSALLHILNDDPGAWD